MLKKIAINIIIFIIVVFLAELSAYFIQVKRDSTRNYENSNILEAYNFSPIKNFHNIYNNYLTNDENNLFRLNLKGRENKRPIILLGCSFAWGANLEDDETFGGQINKHTGRPVVNYSIPGCGITQMIYMASQGFKVKNPEMVIHVYINDQIRRLYIPCSFFDSKNLIFYKFDRNKNLVQKTDWDIFYWHSYFLRSLYELKYNLFSNFNWKEQEEFLLQHFLLLNKEIKKQYPSAKFAILCFQGDETIKEIQSRLEENNITVIYVSELTDIDFSKTEYKTFDMGHPNAKVWEIITPLFLKNPKINLE